MANKLFYLDIIDDLPVLVAIFMSVYPEYRNENVFFLSVFIGISASIFLAKLLKSISIEEFIASFSPAEMLGYIIYIAFMLGFVIYLTVTDRLYMKWFVWGYLAVTFLISIYAVKKSSAKV